jgi:hypothetical protein
VLGNDVVQSWYDEHQFYDYKNPKFDMKTGHFTQVIWKSTTQIGFGLSAFKPSSDSVAFLGVANYYPAGNYLKQFEKNVLPVR